jgi:hypothetical protein
VNNGSDAANVTVTECVYQPFASGGRSGVAVTVGPSAADAAGRRSAIAAIAAMTAAGDLTGGPPS